MHDASMVAQTVKNLSAVQEICSNPGSERSLGEGNDYPLQYLCLGNPMERGAWQATVPAVTKSWTRLTLSLSQHTFSNRGLTEYFLS